MRSLLNNKKSAEMIIGTIIIILLALVVLVFVIYAFTRGGGGLMDALRNFFGGGPNVDQIKSACQVACSTQSVYAFCNQVRDMKTESVTYRGTCNTLAGQGVEACSNINCQGVDLIACKGSWLASCTEALSEDKTSSIQDSQGHDIRKEKCCEAKAAAAPAAPVAPAG